MLTALFFFLIGITNINLYFVWKHIEQLNECATKLRVDLEKHKYEHK